MSTLQERIPKHTYPNTASASTKPKTQKMHTNEQRNKTPDNNMGTHMQNKPSARKTKRKRETNEEENEPSNRLTLMPNAESNKNPPHQLIKKKIHKLKKMETRKETAKCHHSKSTGNTSSQQDKIAKIL